MGTPSSLLDARLEGDVIVCQHRDWTVETADAWMAICKEVRAKYGRAYAIMDMSRGLHIDTDARRRIAQGFRERQLDLVVVIGASLPTRALFTLVSRAIALLRGHPASLRFASKAEEAWDLIALKRGRKARNSRDGLPMMQL